MRVFINASVEEFRENLKFKKNANIYVICNGI